MSQLKLIVFDLRFPFLWRQWDEHHWRTYNSSPYPTGLKLPAMAPKRTSPHTAPTSCSAAGSSILLSANQFVPRFALLRVFSSWWRNSSWGNGKSLGWQETEESGKKRNWFLFNLHASDITSNHLKRKHLILPLPHTKQLFRSRELRNHGPWRILLSFTTVNQSCVAEVNVSRIKWNLHIFYSSIMQNKWHAQLCCLFPQQQEAQVSYRIFLLQFTLQIKWSPTACCIAKYCRLTKHKDEDFSAGNRHFRTGKKMTGSVFK